jgi:hypothetical protein
VAEAGILQLGSLDAHSITLGQLQVFQMAGLQSAISTASFVYVPPPPPSPPSTHRCPGMPKWAAADWMEAVFEGYFF